MSRVVDLGENVYARLYSCAHSEGRPAGAIIQFGGTIDDPSYDRDDVCCGGVNWCPECPGPTWLLKSLEPLHIEPSVRTTCSQHSERHGFIRDGKWVPA